MFLRLGMSNHALEHHPTASIAPAQAQSGFEAKTLLPRNIDVGNHSVACSDGLLELRKIMRIIDEQQRKLTAKLARSVAHEFTPISFEREEEDPLQPFVSSGRTDVASVASLPCEPLSHGDRVAAVDMFSSMTASNCCRPTSIAILEEAPPQTLAAGCCVVVPMPATAAQAAAIDASAQCAADATSRPASPPQAALPPLPGTPTLEGGCVSPLASAEQDALPLPPLSLGDAAARCEPHPPLLEALSSADRPLSCWHDGGRLLCRASLLRCVVAGASPSGCLNSYRASSGTSGGGCTSEEAPVCTWNAALQRVAAYVNLLHTRAGSIVAALLGLHCMLGGREWLQLQERLATLSKVAPAAPSLLMAAAAACDAVSDFRVVDSESLLQPRTCNEQPSQAERVDERDTAEQRDSVRPPSPPAVGAADTGLPLLMRSCCGRVEPPSLLTVVLAVLPLLQGTC